MNEQMKFDEILDEVLRGFANPEPTGGLQQRVMRQVRMARTADGLEEAAAHAQGWSEQPEMASGLAGARLFETGGREEGIFGSLWSGVRELLFPAKLPPLALESRRLLWSIEWLLRRATHRLRTRLRLMSSSSWRSVLR